MNSFLQVREESPSTRLWFVTTGYLVRLLAHQLESFSKYTHLVIDEVHERSADGDIICLLAKKVCLLVGLPRSPFHSSPFLPSPFLSFQKTSHNIIHY